MARIKVEDLPVADNLTPEQEELIQGAGRRSFRPKLEGLEDRQLMASHLAASLPVPPPALGQAQVSLRDFLSTPPEARSQVGQVHTLAYSQAKVPGDSPDNGRAIQYPDPLSNFRHKYLGLKDLRKGDIILNTTEGPLSESIRAISHSNYNHAAIYVGNGKVVEAVGGGVRQIDLTVFLKDDHLVRSMVIRNANLTDTQRDAIATWAIAKVGTPYNVGGLFGNTIKFKPNNHKEYNRVDYFCSQLVAAAHSSAGAPLHKSLELNPGELANMVKSELTALGCLYDRSYHRAVREGQEPKAEDVPALIAAQAESKFHQVMGNGRFNNQWMIQRVSHTQRWWQDGAHTVVGVKLFYTRGVLNDAAKDSIVLYFKLIGTFGGEHQWTFVKCDSNSLGSASLDKKIKEVYNGWSVQAGMVYDQGRIALELAKKVEAVCHANGFFRQNGLAFDGMEAINGGLRIWVKLPDSRLQLDFTYQGRVGQMNDFQLQGLYRYQWSGKWQAIDLADTVAKSLKGASYRVEDVAR
jgi:hypothetical protein